MLGLRDRGRALQRFAKGGRVLNSGRGALTGASIFTGVDQAQGVFARLQSQIATKQKVYDVAERRYNEFAPDVLNADGTLNQEGISERAAELDGLIAIRNQILTLWLRAQAIARQAVTGYSFFIRRLQASLGHARGKDRAGIKKQLSTYRQALADWKGKLSDTGFDVSNAQLDIADTQKEKADVLGTVATADTSGSSGGAGLTPDQQALLDQATALKQVVQSGNFIDATAQRVLATFSPQTGFSSGPPSVASVVGGAAAAPGGAFIAADGLRTVVNINTLHPGDPKVWSALARTANAGNDLMLSRRNVRTSVGA